MFNVVRVLCKHAGLDVWGGGREAFMETTGDEADVYVVKTHPWFEQLATYSDDILTSYRPIKEAWESMRRFKGEEKTNWKVTQKWLQWFEKWRAHDNHRFTMFWDDFMDENGAWNALKDVAHVLDFEHVNLEHCMKHLRSELAPPKEDQKNPDTLVFSNHYTAREYEEDVLPRLRVPERDTA